jgi:hypothetical protein
MLSRRRSERRERERRLTPGLHVAFESALPVTPGLLNAATVARARPHASIGFGTLATLAMLPA